MTLAGCLALLFLWSGFLLNTNAGAQELAAGTGSRSLRKEVVRNLPYAQLNTETKARIGDILEKPSLYRRLPVTAIEIDSEYLQFLIRYPETVVGIWELMGITQMQTKRVGPYTLKTNDGAGTSSNMELVYGSPDLHIYYGDGSYEGPFLRKKLHGQCVIIVRTRPHVKLPTSDGGDITDTAPQAAPKTACQLDVFLKLTNGTAGIIAKTISPIVGPTADHNFTESLKFLQRLNQTTIKNGPGVAQMASRLDIDPHVAEKFKSVAERVFLRGQASRNSPNAFHNGQPNSETRPTIARTGIGNPPTIRQQTYNQRSVYPYPLSTHNASSLHQRAPGRPTDFFLDNQSSVQQAIFNDRYPR
jgi:hypothetical protein